LKGGIGKKNQLRKKTLKISKEWGSKLKKKIKTVIWWKGEIENNNNFYKKDKKKNRHQNN
jgi:hypothetical protein